MKKNKQKIVRILAAIYLIKKRESFSLIGKQEISDLRAIEVLFAPDKIGYELKIYDVYLSGKKEKQNQTKLVFYDEADIITYVIESITCLNSYLFGKEKISIPKTSINFSLFKRIIKRIKEPDSLYFEFSCLESFIQKNNVSHKKNI